MQTVQLTPPASREAVRVALLEEIEQARHNGRTEEERGLLRALARQQARWEREDEQARGAGAVPTPQAGGRELAPLVADLGEAARLAEQLAGIGERVCSDLRRVRAEVERVAELEALVTRYAGLLAQVRDMVGADSAEGIVARVAALTSNTRP